MNEIKSCPFCGGEAEVNTGAFGEKFVSCKNEKQCGGRLGSAVWFNNEEKAIEIWNQRPSEKKPLSEYSSLSNVPLSHPDVPYRCSDPGVICGMAVGDYGCLEGDVEKPCGLKRSK